MVTTTVVVVLGWGTVVTGSRVVVDCTAVVTGGTVVDVDVEIGPDEVLGEGVVTDVATAAVLRTLCCFVLLPATLTMITRTTRATATQDTACMTVGSERNFRHGWGPRGDPVDPDSGASCVEGGRPPAAAVGGGDASPP